MGFLSDAPTYDTAACRTDFDFGGCVVTRLPHDLVSAGVRVPFPQATVAYVSLIASLVSRLSIQAVISIRPCGLEPITQRVICHSSMYAEQRDDQCHRTLHSLLAECRHGFM